ncbi:MAG: PilZ domain-containing protein [Nitrospira sp.]|nr:PilZ domain-containing protein [Nitrospira sp.]MDH4305217.1 PilZ domain-containing protein [Nitrospira sp.]MDH5195095.1 PilZ domain-containing protein [Nitrospira sp.]
MSHRTDPMRRHSRFPVSWPVLYGDGAFLAEGTVLDLTARGWRIAGSMPVLPGMQLTLKVSVPDRSTPLCVHRAIVLWVREHEFAIEASEIAPDDQAWVAEFLRHKLGLMWMPQTVDQKPSHQNRATQPHGEPLPPQSSLPSLEDILRRVAAADLASTMMTTKAHQTSGSDIPQGEINMPADDVPKKNWCEARYIVRRMIAIKAVRVQTGRNPVPEN